MKTAAWLLPLVVIPVTAHAQTQLAIPPAEQAEVEQRLADFYGNPSDPSVMNRPVGKYATATGERVHSHGFLQVPLQPADPLLQQAQMKATPAFRKAVCSPQATRHFKHSPCQTSLAARLKPNAAIESGDAVADLINGWVASADQIVTLDSVPLVGQSTNKPFSDDYWRTQWGGLSYRYSTGTQFKSYADAIVTYAQPHDWAQLAQSTATDGDVQAEIAGWSPAEKYDLAVGDVAGFTLTNAEKGDGQSQIVGSDVPDWVGICDGWGASAIMTPRVSQEVHTLGPQGLAITFYPADVRALVSLSWAQGDFNENFIGGHCADQTPETFPNGRLKNPDCFASNPATFHLAMGNLLGKANQTFIMDASFDAEVWNQPVVSYQTVYFNPLDYTKRSANWKDVAAPYDTTFKARDRFQIPLTRGVRTAGAAGAADTFDDSSVAQIVGVMTSVTYNDEYTPNAGAAMSPDEFATVTYTYDLELPAADSNGNVLPTGGEWQSNAHPNFFWIPEKGAMVTLSQSPPAYNPSQIPPAALTTAAQAASLNLQPLCSVLTALDKQASGQTNAANFSICQ